MLEWHERTNLVETHVPTISNFEMNFPEHQKTGTLAEMSVEAFFISWGWNVGHDRISEVTWQTAAADCDSASWTGQACQ